MINQDPLRQLSESLSFFTLMAEVWAAFFATLTLVGFTLMFIERRRRISLDAQMNVAIHVAWCGTFGLIFLFFVVGKWRGFW